MKVFQKYRSLKRWQRWTLIGLVVLIIYTIVGFLVIPAIAKKVAVGNLKEALSRNVTIEKIKMNPFTLTVTVEGFNINRKDGSNPLFAFRKLFVNAAWKSLFKFAPVVEHLRVEAPYINATRNGDGSFNFSDLLEPQADAAKVEKKESPEEERSVFRFSVANIEISEGQVHFRDEVKNKSHKILDMTVGVPFVSTIGNETEIFVQPSFSADINGTPFAMGGKTKPFVNTRETDLELDLKAIDLPYYMEYLPVDIPISLKSGKLDINTKISFISHEDKSSELKVSAVLNLLSLTVQDKKGQPLLELPRLEVHVAPSRVLQGEINVAVIDLTSPEFFLIRDVTGQMNIHSLSRPSAGARSEPPEKGSQPEIVINIDEFKLNGAAVKYAALPGGYTESGPGIKTLAEDILNIPAFGVRGIRADLKKQEAHIAEISTSQGAIFIKRLADGKLNLETLAVPAAEEAPETEKPSSADKAPSWVISIDRLSVDGYGVRGEDLIQETGAGVVIDSIKIDGEGISTRENSEGRLKMNCRINESGLLTLACDLGLAPLKARVKTDLEKLSIPSVYPFVAQYFPGLISKGALSIGGDLGLTPSDSGTMAMVFKGRVGVTDFASVDRLHSEDLIKFRSLQVEGIDVGTSPVYVNVGEIGLDGLFARISIDTTGRLNLEEKDGPEVKDQDGDKEKGTKGEKAEESIQDESKKDEKPSVEPIPINIGKISLVGGHVQFSDKSLKPAYRTDLTDIKVSLTGLSSKKDKEAILSFKGTLDRQAPLEVSGKINPLAEELFVDVKVKFQNMGLSSLSPYTGKYIGKKIAKGKLFIDLSYLVDKKKLTADNLVFIDQLTLGESVESPDASNLPVGLAISLLQDRNGKIVLNVPLSGSLDEPEFSLGGVILQAFVNILVKAATAPFSLIAAATGGEDLSHLEFQPGSHVLSEDLRNKLDTLAQLLYDRPALAIEVSGFVDKENDSRELVRYLFERKLKARKLEDMIKSGKKPVPIDEVQIEKKEFDKYLQKAYKVETFEKPKNFLGFTKTLPPEEAEALIIQNITVTDNDLKDLADRRAKQVRDYVVQTGKVEPGRIFLIEPKSIIPEAVESVKDSRVDLGFK